MKKKLLKEYCESEFENIDATVKEISEILLQTPNLNKVEIAALGTFIHNFYNGVENILKRICQYKNVVVKNINGYHKFILRKAEEENIIDESLCNELYKFLAFRHFFIHGYSFLLEWEKLKVLAENVESICQKFKSAVYNYIDNSA